MSLTERAIDNKTTTYFFVFLLVVGGIASFLQLGKLEDPEFTVKTAMIFTLYPGASPQEVELEVTNRIEQTIQEMPQLDKFYSLSRAGLSIIRVDIKQEFWADRLGQVWDEMRKKIRDLKPLLPPGAATPKVADDFSFVYGFVLAMTGDGYTYAQLEAYAKSLKRELSLVKGFGAQNWGVSRVELWGVQPKVVYVDVSEAQLSELGLTAEDVFATLQQQNMVVNAGAVEAQSERLRVEVSGIFAQPEEIGELSIRSSLADTMANLTGEPPPQAGALRRAGELVKIKDIATVRRGYLEPPFTMMRFNGQPSIGIQIANAAGANVVETGRVLDKRLAEILPTLPVGIEVHRVAWQSDLVTESINNFMINLAEAVLIVLVVLTLAMGWRMGLIIGSGLVFTILGTFVFMAIFGINLHRVSLGALIIALGMMVDNAIVVADGIWVRLQQKMERKQAAIESATQPSVALLGATIVAVMAFYPIYGNSTDSGEYAGSLFLVAGISLGLSWVLALTVTPLQCMALLSTPSDQDEVGDAYSGRLYQGFRRLLSLAIRGRWLFLGGMVVLLVAAIVGFGQIDQQFFPTSTRPQLMIDYWAPQGTRIQQVSADLKGIEARLMANPRVLNVNTFIGAGAPRFYIPVDPELPYSSYAQIVVNTHSYQDVNPIVADMEPWLYRTVPQAMTRVRKYSVGPSDTWPFEVRISGPADADLNVLRSLGEQGMAILKQSQLAKEIRIDMRQRVKKIVTVYNQERGRWAVTSREDIGRSVRRAYDGLVVGVYREGEDLWPIIVRDSEEERRKAAADLGSLQVVPTLSTQTVPLAQVSDDIRVEWEDPIIPRWNRRRAVTIQAAPDGVTFAVLRARVLDAFNALDLPPGYEILWDGEFDSQKLANEALIPGLIAAAPIILLILVVLFNALRPPLIILLTIPFALIGITAGLLLTDIPFGFMALLGAMSLAGMMIKNAIVLLDQIKLELAAGKRPYDAVVDSAVSRLRPVVLAAATTVLGVVPLLQDPFWMSMGATIMAGLTFGTILTMVVVPVLYACFYRLSSP
ncbi:MAG: efflux RND transporter permease subunit [bacterium]|nr:efflux RND transporter permease subunit [bacterium]